MSSTCYVISLGDLVNCSVPCERERHMMHMMQVCRASAGSGSETRLFFQLGGLAALGMAGRKLQWIENRLREADQS